MQTFLFVPVPARLPLHSPETSDLSAELLEALLTVAHTVDFFLGRFLVESVRSQRKTLLTYNGSLQSGTDHRLVFCAGMGSAAFGNLFKRYALTGCHL